MNNLEDLYNDNKESFDRLEPKENTWASIQQSLNANQEIDDNKPKRRSKKFPAFILAIGLILLIGISSIFILNKEDEKATIYSSLTEACENESLVFHTGEPAYFDPSKNKYTLVQFWSSGNALCIEENCYYYLPAYETYKDKGFEIYAVSLDSDLASWVTGIEENALPWHHVSDLKGWDSPICTECDITKVPASYLLNQQGELLAKDLDASRLEETLAMLFAEE